MRTQLKLIDAKRVAKIDFIKFFLVIIRIKSMRSHMDNSFGYSSSRSTWDTSRPQPPPRRRANSLQHNSDISTSIQATIPARRSLFNTTVVCSFFYRRTKEKSEKSVTISVLQNHKISSVLGYFCGN